MRRLGGGAAPNAAPGNEKPGAGYAPGQAVRGPDPGGRVAPRADQSSISTVAPVVLREAKAVWASPACANG